MYNPVSDDLLFLHLNELQAEIRQSRDKPRARQLARRKQAAEQPNEVTR
jgi:hypothetical protein